MEKNVACFENAPQRTGIENLKEPKAKSRIRIGIKMIRINITPSQTICRCLNCTGIQGKVCSMHPSSNPLRKKVYENVIFENL